MKPLGNRRGRALAHSRQALMSLWEMDISEFSVQIAAAHELAPELWPEPVSPPEQELQSFLLAALEALEKQIRDWPDIPERAQNLLLTQLMDKLWQAGPQTYLDVKAAIYQYRKHYPDFPGLDVLEIQACYHGQQTQEGLELASKALLTRPESSQLLHLKVQLLIQAKRHDEAQLLVTDALKRFGDDTSLLQDLGALRLARQDFAAAVPPLQTAFSQNPLRPDIRASLHAALRLQQPGYRRWHQLKLSLPSWLNSLWKIFFWPLDASIGHLADLKLANTAEKIETDSEPILFDADLGAQVRLRLLIVLVLGLGYYYLLWWLINLILSRI